LGSDEEGVPDSVSSPVFVPEEWEAFAPLEDARFLPVRFVRLPPGELGSTFTPTPEAPEEKPPPRREKSVSERKGVSDEKSVSFLNPGGEIRILSPEGVM